MKKHSIMEHSTTPCLCAIFIFLTMCFSVFAQEKGRQPANCAASADEFVEYAKKFVGKPFLEGGKGTEQFDGAGFIQHVYAQFGVSLAESTVLQYKNGAFVGKRDIRKGDIVFFRGRFLKRKSIRYAGIVTEASEGKYRFLYVSDEGVRYGSSEESYFKKHYKGTRRVAEFGFVAKAEENQPDTVSEPEPAEPQTAKKTRIRIAMVGDMMLGTTYPENQLPANQGKNLFDDVKKLLVDADIAAGNFEGAMCEGGTCTKDNGKYSFAFRMPPSYAGLFAEAGFDFVSLANNHSNDFGTAGAKETMRCLDSVGIRYAGVKGLCESAILERDGMRYGFCAFGHNSHTYRHYDTNDVKNVLQPLRDSADILIVSFHGGGEGKDKTHVPYGTEMFLDENRGDLRTFTHLCIDMGADVVFGHGPHVCRAIELYKGHFIAYSLGNFCTPGGISVSGISGYSPVITITINENGELIDGKISSFIQPYGKGPRLDASNTVAKFIRTLTLEDFPKTNLCISDDGSFVPTE